MLVIVARPSSAVEFRLQGNVGSCALRLHVDLGRDFGVDLAQTSIQFLLQAMQLETQLHLSTVGAHCFSGWSGVKLNVFIAKFCHVRLSTSGNIWLHFSVFSSQQFRLF